MRSQTGYIAVLFAALLALGLTLVVGTLVAQLQRSGTLNRSLVAGGGNGQQTQLAANQQKLLVWYQNNAYAVDSVIGQPNLNQVLTQAGTQLNGATADVTDLVIDNGVGYHVFALWFPVPGAVGTGLNHANGQFAAGMVAGQPANTPYILVSGQALESQLAQQTRTNMYRIADLLTRYFGDQQAADADMSADINWFRSATCATGTMALPCYGTDNTSATAVPVSETVLQTQVGLSQGDLVTAWAPNTLITINNYTTATLPPFSVVLNTVLPWGSSMTVDAVSN